MPLANNTKKQVRKDRRHMTLGDWAKYVGVILVVVGGYGTLSADNATQKERVDNLKATTTEIKADVREIRQDVQTILRKIESIDTSRQINDRDARERDRATSERERGRGHSR